MKPEKLKEVLAQHKLWLDTYGKEGKCANLKNANLPGANLEGANLSGVNLRSANLERVRLYCSTLEGTNLQGANLQEADLIGANLSWANLSDANLSDANLRSASLWGAKLCGTTGNMKEIKSLQIDTYSIAYTADKLQIGCENHSIEEWKIFNDGAIKKMGRIALPWWKKYRDHIFKTIELSPATPTGHEGKQP